MRPVLSHLDAVLPKLPVACRTCVDVDQTLMV